jgi:hypothetical protein
LNFAAGNRFLQKSLDSRLFIVLDTKTLKQFFFQKTRRELWLYSLPFGELQCRGQNDSEAFEGSPVAGKVASYIANCSWGRTWIGDVEQSALGPFRLFPLSKMVGWDFSTGTIWMKIQTGEQWAIRTEVLWKVG